MGQNKPTPVLLLLLFFFFFFFFFFLLFFFIFLLLYFFFFLLFFFFFVDVDICRTSKWFGSGKTHENEEVYILHLLLL